MDSLSKTWKQLTGLFGSLTPSQRLSLVVAPLLLVVGFGYLLWNGSSAVPMTPLVGGKALTPAELDTAISVLHQRGLVDYERDGNQLLVPAADVAEYHGALLAGGGLPNGWGEMFEQELDGSSVFDSNERLQTMREIALAKFIREWLRTVPEVMDGNVVWARSQKRSRFSREGPAVTATVTLRAKPGHEITPRLADSIRRMTANAIPDLTPERVLVFDSTTGRAFTPEDDDDPLGSRLVRRIREFSDEYRARVESALSYIPDVLVTVHVDVDNVASAVESSLKVNPKEVTPLVQITEDKTRTSADVQPRAEPGATANRPGGLNTANGPRRDERDQTTREEVLQAPSYSQVRRVLVAAMPTGVSVSIGIPEDYYESAVAQKGVDPGTDEAGKKAFEKAVAEFRSGVETDVTASVSNAIGAPPEKVSVTSYVRVAPADAPLPPLPWMDVVGEWIRRWGGTAGLALFALVALLAMRRTGSANPDAEAEAADEEEDDEPDEPFDAAEADEPPEPTAEELAHSELQNAVRDNPEMAAAVIGKWIQAGAQ